MMYEKLDYALVPLGLLVLGIYHVWLLFTIIRHPTTTIIGLNSASRYQWVYHMMSDQAKNGVLAVQTLRNNLMASTLLATIAITLSSLITALVSSSSTISPTSTLHTLKYFSVLICFLIAFFCNMQCCRYYAHASFLLNVPSLDGTDDFVEYVAQTLNRGGLFWSLGLRAFYFSFPLLLWIFGPIPMLACSCFMVLSLYFLDTVRLIPRSAPIIRQYYKETNNHDIESLADSIDAGHGDCNPYCSLLENNRLGSTTDIVIN